ncbi:MAG: hypothetical protein R3B96_04180 [Pirellulaceae bacterium]
MNPITQCVLLEWSEEASVIAEPDGYDARCYRDHGYPDEPRWIYESRRIVDSTDPRFARILPTPPMSSYSAFRRLIIRSTSCPAESPRGWNKWLLARAKRTSS